MAVWLVWHGLAPDEPDGRSFPDGHASIPYACTDYRGQLEGEGIMIDPVMLTRTSPTVLLLSSSQLVVVILF